MIDLNERPFAILTNTREESGYAPWEDELLAVHFRKLGVRNAKVIDVRDAPAYLGEQKHPERAVLLVRNLWPVNELTEAIDAMQAAADATGAFISPPPRQTSGRYGEDKEYLVRLSLSGKFNDTVPRTWRSGPRLNLPERFDGYVRKPFDGCSSIGVECIEHDDPKRLEPGYIVQPWLDLKDEVSYYFVDGKHIYATRSQGQALEAGAKEVNFERRWLGMAEHPATSGEIAWAKRFEVLSGQPYGLVRIDAGRLAGEADPVKRLQVVELETFSSFGSFDAVGGETQLKFAGALLESVQKSAPENPLPRPR